MLVTLLNCSIDFFFFSNELVYTANFGQFLSEICMKMKMFGSQIGGGGGDRAYGSTCDNDFKLGSTIEHGP